MSKLVGLVGWRGMVGSVLMDRMEQEKDFDLIEPMFFSTSNAGGKAPAQAKNETALQDAFNIEALKRCVAVLDAGEPLVMFPEGTRQSGSVLQPLFDGPAYVALKRGVPIVPVGIGGSEKVMRKGSKMIWPRKCHLTIGVPIIVERSTTSRVDRERMAAVTAELAVALQAAFDDARRRVGDA